MLKSLQSDLLHDAESRDLKVIVISGIYPLSILSILQNPEEVFPNSLTGAFPHLRGELFEAPL